MSQIIQKLDQQQLKSLCGIVAHTSEGLTKSELAKPFATFRYYCLMCVYARLGLTVTRRWDKVNDAQGTNHSPLGIHFSMSNRG